MKLTWIGQSGYVLETARTKIILDPYLSDVVNRVAGRPRLVEAPFAPRDVNADAIICTHDHLDHLDVDAVAEMNRNIPFLTTKKGKVKLENMGFTKVTALGAGQSALLGDVTIHAVFAHHTVEAFGVVMEAEGQTLYFSGDTLYDEELFSIADFCPDFTFICINGKLGNMNVVEAALTANRIGAKVSIPTHYGMFASNTEDPTRFTALVNNSRILEYNQTYDTVELLRGE